MRIEQSNPYATAYSGIGSKNVLAKYTAFDQPPEQQQESLSPLTPNKQIYSYLIPTGEKRLAVNINEDGATVYNDRFTTEIQALANKCGCTVTSDGTLLSSNGVPIDKKTLEEFVEHEIIDNKKIEDVNHLLKEMGIQGEVKGSNFSRVPNAYSMFYIEMADGKNMVVTQLESGKYMIANTSLNPQDFLNSWSLFSSDNGISNEKLSEEALEKLFRKFIGADVEIVEGNLSDSLMLQEQSKNDKPKY